MEHHGVCLSLTAFLWNHVTDCVSEHSNAFESERSKISLCLCNLNVLLVVELISLIRRRIELYL